MASKHVETRIIVDASPARVYEVLTDFGAYPSWCRQLSLRLRDGGGLRPGARAWLFVKPSPLPVPCRIVVTEEGRELRWIGGPRGLIHGSHSFELRPVDGEPDKTELVHAETFTGLLVPLIWPLASGRLERIYAAMNEGLAARARCSD